MWVIGFLTQQTANLDASNTASVASTNKRLWLLFAWAPPPTILMTELTNCANADFFFFFFLLHLFCSRYCNSAWMAKQRKKLIGFHFWSGLEWFCCCQKLISHRSNWNSEFEIGPPAPKPEVMRLFLSVITSYDFWFIYIFQFLSLLFLLICALSLYRFISIINL